MAMGRIDADFHCVGTMDNESDKFIRAATGAAKKRLASRLRWSLYPKRMTDKKAGDFQVGMILSLLIGLNLCSGIKSGGL